MRILGNVCINTSDECSLRWPRPLKICGLFNIIRLITFYCSFWRSVFSHTQDSFVFISCVPNIINPSHAHSSSWAHWKIFLTKILSSFFISHIPSRLVFAILTILAGLCRSRNFSLRALNFSRTLSALGPHTFLNTLYKYRSQCVENNNWYYIDCRSTCHLCSPQDFLGPSDQKI